METYYFRFLDGDRQPTGYVGLVTGQDMADVFHQIDQYGDPYSVQLRPAIEGSFCIKIEEGTEFEAGEDMHEALESEGWFDFPRDFSPY